MPVGRRCPTCECFDVRPVPIGGEDLQAYQCHDCQHIFYISVDDLRPEPEDMRAAHMTRLRKKEKREGDRH